MRKIGCLAFLIIVLAIAGVGFYFWNFYNDTVKNPKSGSDEKKIITIEASATVEDIEKKLVEEGIIKDAKFPNGMSVFKVYSVTNKLDSKYQAGTYFLPQNLSIEQVAEALQRSKDELLTVTLREGLRIEEFGAAISLAINTPENSKISQFKKDEFINLAKNYPDANKAYEFLSTRPAGDVSLEGYLYPDTYFVTKNVDAKGMVELLLKTFNQKVYQPNKAAIKNNKFTFHELVTLASIIEREANIAEERGKVADIFFRRLSHDNDTGGKLESDVTIQYVVGNEKDGWWPKDIDYKDLDIKSPYNTRVNEGFPPGPIDNPGLTSITAVLQPTANDYIFFIAGDDGKMYYAKTLYEHSVNINKHCKKLCF